MLAKHYKELWKARFKKMLESEKYSLVFYRRLLKEKSPLLSMEAKKILQEILRDEIKHARIAKELLRLVDEKVISDNMEIDEGGRSKFI